MTMTDKELQELNVYCVRFLIAKQSAGCAKTNQKAARDEIANRVPRVGDAQQRTITLLDGAKLVVKRGFNTRVNEAGIAALFANDPQFAGMPPPLTETVVLSLDTKGYEWYRVNHPALFVKMAEQVTLTPKEVSVTVTPKKVEG